MIEFTVPPEIAAIIERLHTQDNRITANPLFAVQQRRRIYGLDADYREGVVWVNDEGGESPVKVAGSRKVGYVDKWEFVTGGLTEHGCKDFIACNGHNLNEPRIYAYGSYRNAEFIAVRQWLMSLRPARVEAPAEPLPLFAAAVARRKWESLQADGYRMQRIHFARSIGGQDQRGSIDPWGKVLWEPDGVAQGGDRGAAEVPQGVDSQRETLVTAAGVMASRAPEQYEAVGTFMEDGGRWLKMDAIYANDPDAVTLYRRATGVLGTSNEQPKEPR